jgi:hypothetical protein
MSAILHKIDRNRALFYTIMQPERELVFPGGRNIWWPTQQEALWYRGGKSHPSCPEFTPTSKNAIKEEMT